MEYRKKNLNPKPKFEEQLLSTLTSEDQMRRFDMQSYLKKTIQAYQKKKRFECVKPCTITCKCLTSFLNEKIFLMLAKYNKKGIYQPMILQLNEENVRKRVLEALVQDFKRQPVSMEDHEKLEKACDQIATGEIKSIFNKRISKLLNQFLHDRQSTLSMNQTAMARSNLSNFELITVAPLDNTSAQIKQIKVQSARKNTDITLQDLSKDNSNQNLITPIKLKEPQKLKLHQEISKSDGKSHSRTPHNLESSSKNDFSSPQQTRPNIQQFEDVYQQSSQQNQTTTSQEHAVEEFLLQQERDQIAIKHHALEKVVSQSKEEEDQEKKEREEEEILRLQLNVDQGLKKQNSQVSDSIPEIQIIHKRGSSDTLSNKLMNSCHSSEDTSPSDIKETQFKSKNKLLLKANELTKSDIQSPGNLTPNQNRISNSPNSYSKSGVGADFKLEIISTKQQAQEERVKQNKKENFGDNLGQ